MGECTLYVKPPSVRASTATHTPGALAATVRALLGQGWQQDVALLGVQVNVNIRKAMPYAKISMKKQREANANDK